MLPGGRLVLNADDPVLDATLTKGRPHEQAVAIFLLGENKSRTSGPAIAKSLANPYPLVRFYAAASLEKIFDVKPEVDVYAEPDEIQEQTSKWLAKVSAH